MNALKIFLVRHGGTEWTRERRFTGGRAIPLSAEGHARAEAVAGVLEGQRLTAVYSSPLERARATAELVAKPHRMDVRTEPAFRDMAFGEWEGLAPSEIEHRFPELWRAWRESPAAVSPPGGESLDEVARRVASGIDAIRAAYPGGTVAVVTHAMPIRLVVLAALGLVTDRLWSVDASPAGLTELEYAHDWVTVHRMNTVVPGAAP